jgi:hypothetical protein
LSPPPHRSTAERSTKAKFYEGLVERLELVAGAKSYKAIGDSTGTNFETTRRYMQTGRFPARFAAEFCRAFELNPKWLLYGTGRMRAR